MRSPDIPVIKTDQKDIIIMRQSAIVFLLVLLQVMNLFAQHPAINIDAGLSFSKWDPDASVAQFDNKFKVVLLAGNADFPVAPRVTVQTELHYAMFGSEYSYGDQYAMCRANYVLLPVLARYHMDNGLSVFFGPQGGLLVRARSTHDRERHDVKDAFERTDFFLVAATEYHTREGIHLGLRYHHGLKNVDRDEGMSVKNRGFSLNVTYELKGGWSELMKSIFK